MALVLSEATFDQIVELPGVGPTRARQFFELMEDTGGRYMVFATQHWGSRLGGVGRLRNNCF